MLIFYVLYGLLLKIDTFLYLDHGTVTWDYADFSNCKNNKGIINNIINNIMNIPII